VRCPGEVAKKSTSRGKLSHLIGGKWAGGWEKKRLEEKTCEVLPEGAHRAGDEETASKYAGGIQVK